MNTKLVEQAKNRRGKEFEQYFDCWLRVNGHLPASRWMAGHIGWHDAEIDALKSRVRKLEKQLK